MVAISGPAAPPSTRLQGRRRELRVIPLELDAPTADFTQRAGHDRGGVRRGRLGRLRCRAAGADLVCLGEMGIGNTTAASAVAAALFGGGGERWAGRGTGVDDAGLARKRAVIDAGLKRHQTPSRTIRSRAQRLRRPRACRYPWRHARRPPHGIPVLLDGFVGHRGSSTTRAPQAGASTMRKLRICSAEAGHRGLCAELGMRPILDLDMRLGEGSGAALSVSVLRAALACHLGMATFDEAGVDERG